MDDEDTKKRIQVILDYKILHEVFQVEDVLLKEIENRLPLWYGEVWYNDYIEQHISKHVCLYEMLKGWIFKKITSSGYNHNNQFV